jgi:membrane fusion protein, multidrug efflux system
MTDTANHNGNGTRRRWLIILGVSVLAVALLYAAYWFFYARFYIETNDAYVAGDVVAITSREQGTVLALHADDTQSVERGQLLVELDPVKAKVDVAAAAADLARTVRAVRGNFSKADELRAEADAARIALKQAEDDYTRRQAAGASVSREDLDHARDAVTTAKAKVAATNGAFAQALATVEGTEVADNPDVLAAEAKLRQACIVLAHMHLVAPVSGVVAERTVQLGQQIAPGTPLMAVVPLEAVWIDANFKEGQLSDMRVGQPVTVTADIYGGGVKYHGHVEGLGAGSGSAFALLPPQNASGNWIKIVQRVPVRIALDAGELHAHPLRIGLSVDVDVDVADTSGRTVTSARASSVMRATTGDDGTQEADRLIKQILARNGI